MSDSPGKLKGPEAGSAESENRKGAVWCGWLLEFVGTNLSISQCLYTGYIPQHVDIGCT